MHGIFLEPRLCVTSPLTLSNCSSILVLLGILSLSLSHTHTHTHTHACIYFSLRFYLNVIYSLKSSMVCKFRIRCPLFFALLKLCTLILLYCNYSYIYLFALQCYIMWMKWPLFNSSLYILSQEKKCNQT